MKRLNNHGFTIVELMIATAILSLILLMATGMMLSIGKLFDKGVNQSRVQDSVRTITDDIAANLKVNGKFQPGGNAGQAQAICIGSVRYTYILDTQIDHTVTDPHDPSGTSGPVYPHVLWRDTPSDNMCSPALIDDPSGDPDRGGAVGSNGTEMVPPGSRLTAFSVVSTGATGPYTIKVGVAYGDSDLLDFSDPNNIKCSGSNGDQFCATANLTTTVAQRVIQ